MALNAAVAGQGVVLESDLLASEELRVGKLIELFGDADFAVATTTYHLVWSTSSRNSAKIAVFDTWLRAELGTSPV